MNAPTDRHRREAARWLASARENIHVVGLAINDPQPLPGPATYHCQQAAEKLLNGLLIAQAQHFPFTHDLETLGPLASPLYPGIAAVLRSSDRMTSWNTEFRYPSSGLMENDPPDIAEIEAALTDIAVLVDALASAVAV